MAKEKIIILEKENYLAVIKNSVDSRMFQNVYALVNSKKTDLTKKGNLSCALYVSSILKVFDLIKNIHLTVDSTIENMKKSGWQEVKLSKIKPGDIIVWAEKNNHQHIGFFIGNKKAVSNNSKTKKIANHHFTFNGQRKIEKILTHKLLK